MKKRMRPLLSAVGLALMVVPWMGVPVSADEPPAEAPASTPAAAPAVSDPSAPGAATPESVAPAATEVSASPTPEGPSRAEQRKIDMKEISALSRKIAELIEADALSEISGPAERIRELASGMRAHYDFGMEDPETNAIPEVFQSAKVYEFRREIDFFERDAANLRDAAKTETGVRPAAAALFNRCKTCHEPFLRKRP